MLRSREATIERLRSVLSRRPERLEADLFRALARGEAQAHSDVAVAVFLDSAARSDSGWGSAAEIAADLVAQRGRNAPGLSPSAASRRACAGVWAVERALELCAQNAVDIATHRAATAGRDAADYSSSID
jgi:predicted nucleotidyltransferase